MQPSHVLSILLLLVNSRLLLHVFGPLSLSFRSVYSATSQTLFKYSLGDRMAARSDGVSGLIGHVESNLSSYRTSRGMASTSCANATSAELMCIPLAVLSIGAWRKNPPPA